MKPIPCAVLASIACALLASIAVAAGAVLAAQEPSALPAVVARQEAVEHEFARSPFSPFTAVASKYFSGTETSRLVVRDGEPAFAAPGVDGGLAEVAFDGREMWVAPVAGGPALGVLGKMGENRVESGGGEPLRGRTRLRADQVVRVERFYLETGARPGTGRAILYDAESAARKAFAGLHWFPASAAYQVRAAFLPFDTPDPIVVTTSRGLQRDYFRLGAFAFELEGRTLRLVALATSAAPKPGDELFVPFRDATTGRESYAVGRYLTIPYQARGANYTIDFNLATNPYCAYSPHYNCVIPPKENTLPVAVRAGEMTYAKH